MVEAKQSILESKDKVEKIESLQKKQVKIDLSIKYRKSHACRGCKHLGLMCIAR